MAQGGEPANRRWRGLGEAGGALFAAFVWLTCSNGAASRQEAMGEWAKEYRAETQPVLASFLELRSTPSSGEACDRFLGVVEGARQAVSRAPDEIVERSFRSLSLDRLRRGAQDCLRGEAEAAERSFDAGVAGLRTLDNLLDSRFHLQGLDVVGQFRPAMRQFCSELAAVLAPVPWAVDHRGAAAALCAAPGALQKAQESLPSAPDPGIQRTVTEHLVPRLAEAAEACRAHQLQDAGRKAEAAAEVLRFLSFEVEKRYAVPGCGQPPERAGR